VEERQAQENNKNKKKKKWLLVAYDVPNEPSKSRVKVWRDLKSHGGLYPQMSFCIIPYTSSVLTKLDQMKSEVEKVGKMLMLEIEGFSQSDKEFLQQLMNEQTERQYLEILEECQEFLDEIKSNIRKRVFKEEEIQELDESLEGLRRWFGKVRAFDMQKSSEAMQKVREELEKCQKSLDDYASDVELRKKSGQKAYK
jgi:hypothetical protein